MKKIFLVFATLFLVTILGTGCENRREDVTTDNVEDGKESTDEIYDGKDIDLYPSTMKDTSDLEGEAVATGNGTSLKNYQVPLNIEELIGVLDEEPDWSMGNFGSIEAFDNFCSTMSIPKVITDIYDEHKANGELNEYGKVEFWNSTYQEDGSIQSPYFEVEEIGGKYYIASEFQKTVIIGGQGFFKNGDNLIIISVVKYSRENLEASEYLPEYVRVLCRTEISKEGRINTEYENLDTALLEDRNFNKLMVCPEFTLVFYTEINELLCVKDSQAIGPITNVDSDDLYSAYWKGSGGLGTIKNRGMLNEENTLIYPAIVKNDQGTSFELLHIAKVESFDTKMNTLLWAWIGNSSIAYPVVNGNVVYYVDGATEPDYEVAYMYDLDWIAPISPIVVSSSESKVKRYNINYNDLQYELCDGSEEGYVQISMYNEDIKAVGNMYSPIDCIKHAIQEGRFPQYISKEGDLHYEIPTYSETLQVLSDLDINSD